MNGLFLHTGNRLETLAAQWAGVTAQPLASPFSRETVLVQSLGMRRWLSLQLAGRLGVCMNAAFPFPRAFLDETLRRLVPETAPADAFAPDTLAWKLHGLLPALLHRPEFAPVRAYLGDGDGLKRYQLASRLAGLFDQYLVYRPQMLLGWERGGVEEAADAAWQAALWRELNREKAIHFAAAVERLRQERTAPDARWPERVSLFGITSLPPAQVDVFFALAARCPVHLFLLAPSREYHGDDLTPKQRARRGLKLDGGGHPLLTSLGRLNAEFTNVLLEADERAGHRIVDTPEHFAEPPEGTLLHGLQRDILRAQSRGEPAAGSEEEPLPPLEIAPGDASLEIHVCPSPLREVEALYDRLLALLAEDPALRPRDILVMTPEIERYAPLIHAVFGSPEDANLRIPYSIADRAPRSDSPAIQTFLALLESVETRCTAREGFALLQSPVFRARFGFDDADLARLREWIAESGIRWGVDGAHRAELGLPAFEETTWRGGIDRLLLGYAMPGGGRTLFEGILPEDSVEGSEAELLGRFAEAMEAVFSSLELLESPRPLGEWPGVLRTVIDRFFTSSSGESPQLLNDVRALRDAVERLATVAGLAGPEQIAEFAAVREHFAGMLGEAEQRGGFLTGGVTFCALKPMRSIPARVIWLMGMNDDVFPRRPQPPPFDLIHAHPLPGDRSARADDRYLFLEALLSARDRLRISYVGRSLSGQETLPPSVVVSELLDCLDTSCRFPGGTGAREALTLTHRLHAFSRVYFEPGGRLFSFSAANCAAAARKTARGVPFLERPLDPPEPERRAVALADLRAFFANPAAVFLRERLAIRLSDRDETLEETEPLAPDALQRYQVASELFAAMAADTPPAPAAALFARGLLPPGSVGTQYYQGQGSAARTLHAAMARLLGTTHPDAPRLLDLRAGPFTLTGRLDALYGGRLAFFRPAKLKAKDRLQAWCAHLAWCAACGPTLPLPTVLAGTDGAVQFAPQPPERLLELLELFWQGLQAPLPFFPNASLTFAASQDAKGKPPLERAREVWRGNVRAKGECEDPSFRLCFSGGDAEGGDPLDAAFEAVALAVFGPLLEAEEAIP
ncbi:MAG: exodeoxyribonuclease V subunit gamma [Chthoniobacteraceae bacterium]|nr:exodeoxyribonuclease V subunit gamma [Chthoniobacteraceae bacterium]